MTYLAVLLPSLAATRAFTDRVLRQLPVEVREAADRVRPLVKPELTSTLFLAVSTHKPATPLGRRAMRLLKELVSASADGELTGHNRTR